MKDRTWDEMYRYADDADRANAEKILRGTMAERDMARAIMDNGYQCRVCGKWFGGASSEDGHDCWKRN